MDCYISKLKCFCIAFTLETGGKTHGGKTAVFLAGLFSGEKKGNVAYFVLDRLVVHESRKEGPNGDISS